MALIVEDGTGKSNADAFVSVTDCDTYCTAQGLTDWTAVTDNTLKENAIRRATVFLSTGFWWKGMRAQARLQSLAWPRVAVFDAENSPVRSDEVPVEIVRACCEVAAREVVTPGITSPDVTLTERIRSEDVGPIRTEFAAVPMTADASRPVMTKVLDIVGGLLSGSASGLVGSAVRG